MDQQEFVKQRWQTMTLAQQLGNVGSDYERALKWKKLQKPELFSNAARRTLAQLDMTLTDSRHRGPRRREIARVREVVCGELFSSSLNPAISSTLAKYFLSMAILARKNRV